MRYYVLITGASSGIGESACKKLLRHGYEVVAGVRSEADALRLQNSLGPKLHPLLMDVTDEIGMEKAKQRMEGILGDGTLVAIINNAGIVVSGAVLYIPIAEWQKQFDVNVLGVIRTTQLFFPFLTKPRAADDIHPRRIINMSSVSGLFASPFLGPYAASKFALEAISDSLRRELFMYDVQVVLIEPGSILTPIWEKAKTTDSYLGPEFKDIQEFKNKIIDNSLSNGLAVNAVDDIILEAVQTRKVKARYLIRPKKWKFKMIRMLPSNWVDRMIHKRLREKSGIRPF